MQAIQSLDAFKRVETDLGATRLLWMMMILENIIALVSHRQDL